VKRFTDALTVRLVVAFRHWLRCAVVLLCLSVFMTGGSWFGDALADAMER
jgi:hypothetical protein